MVFLMFFALGFSQDLTVMSFNIRLSFLLSTLLTAFRSLVVRLTVPCCYCCVITNTAIDGVTGYAQFLAVVFAFCQRPDILRPPTSFALLRTCA